MSPQDAVVSGDDVSICGSCPQRPSLGGKCYVSVARAPLAVWKAYRRGRYQEIDLDHLPAFNGKILRIGSYGDPVAIPVELWEALLHKGKLSAWTGYTHQWRHREAYRYQGFLMASVDSPEEFVAAATRGWKCFRTRGAGDALLRGELVCPPSAEAGHKTTCSACRACNGQRGHRVIVLHGFRAGKVS
jgi:hypothetical protein